VGLVADQITGGDRPVTSVDPYNRVVGSVADPTIETWANVYYSDLYYQLPGLQDVRKQFNTSLLTNVDWLAPLNGAATLTNPQQNVFEWYKGTADLSEPVKPDAFRRVGDLDAAGYSEAEFALREWYRPLHLDATTTLPATAPWEGIGEGWFYSVLGGGYTLRPYGYRGPQSVISPIPLRPTGKDVGIDNTIDPATGITSNRMRGDYAVPTLFGGNFDAIAAGTNVATSTALIPGWTAAQNKLVDAHSVTSLTKYFTSLNADLTQSDYALKLSGNGDSINHNPFVIPDWGVLRFDLHTGDVPKNSSVGKLKVFIKPLDNNLITEPIAVIDLKEAGRTRGSYKEDTRRIDYGENGFETFTLNLPDQWRGKVATLTFQLEGSHTVYLDNVFFKSQHLLLGNPTSATDSPSVSNYENNYLSEKPQFAVSYSKDDNIPNWSA
jgi:hypothetical protein